MDACECSGGARAGSLRPERHTRKPRAPYGAAGKRSSQRSHNPVRGKKGKRRIFKEYSRGIGDQQPTGCCIAVEVFCYNGSVENGFDM
ncbi:hypothetical protein NDU88_005510 [Pleurodeles waltl]|uniref:Uncharacterized protein n=1 Tax=Pleurodeles waltl TaxID=8319 RepID=A0AAV7TUI4_PLEWA|nr:hypothetical protein NDU88_005510 [Pleurodeles waltl]